MPFFFPKAACLLVIDPVPAVFEKVVGRFDVPKGIGIGDVGRGVDFPSAEVY